MLWFLAILGVLPGCEKEVAPASDLKTYRSVAGIFECRIRDGATECRGKNAQGVLGHSRLDAAQESWEPVQGAVDVKTLALGGSHVCALRLDETVSCWGLNDFGQLGMLPSMKPPEIHLRPVPVPGVHDAVAITAALGFSCALTRSGSVYCWGEIVATEPERPHAMHTPRATRLVGSASQACVLDEKHDVFCWGGYLLQLDGNSVSLRRPTLIERARGADELVAGEMYVCARSHGADLFCWWSNGDGGPVSPDVKWLEK